MLVLVADDARAVREALERALQLAGYDVELASDGDAALAAIAQRTPDAVVLDVMMPGYDGLDVTRRLRREGNRIPVLLLTARDAVGDRVDGLDAGADDYLPKPFALEELLARLRALLRRAVEAEPAVVLAAASLTVYLLVRSDLRSQVDNGLKSHAAVIQRDSDPHDAYNSVLGDGVQLIDGNGSPIPPYPGAAQILPIDAATRAVATGRDPNYFIRDKT